MSKMVKNGLSQFLGIKHCFNQKYSQRTRENSANAEVKRRQAPRTRLPALRTRRHATSSHLANAALLCEREETSLWSSRTRQLARERGGSSCCNMTADPQCFPNLRQAARDSFGIP